MHFLRTSVALDGRIQSTLTILSVIVFTGGLFSCGRNGREQSKIVAPLEPSSNPTASTAEYLKSEKVNQFGKLESYQIVPKVYEKLAQDIQHQTLQSIHLSKNFNTEAFFVGGKQTPPILLLKPQVLIQSSLDGKRVYPREQKDGTIVIDISIAFLDGLSSTLATGAGSKQVPDEFLVKDKEEFLAELEKEVHAKPTFVTSIPCPDNILLHSQVDGSFPLVFQTKLPSCPLNTFFPAQFTLRKREWQSLVESFLREGSLKLTSQINIASPIIEGIHLFTLSSGMLLKEIQTRSEKISKGDHLTKTLTADGVKSLIDGLLTDPQFIPSFSVTRVSQENTR